MTKRRRYRTSARTRALTRERGRRLREQRKAKDPVAHADVTFNGAMLAALVQGVCLPGCKEVRVYLTDAETTDRRRVNAAMTRALRDYLLNETRFP
jgi:hypothetical protein